MEARLIVAYSLIAAMTLLAAVFVAYRMYHSRDRAYRRRLRKEQNVAQTRKAAPRL